jgi:hypothetical protein
MKTLKQESYQEWLQATAASARAAALEREAKATKLRRENEADLRARGLAGPFDDLVYSDIEALRKSGRFEMLFKNAEFQKRVEVIEAEMEGSLAVLREAEDAAVREAVSNMPEGVALAREHEKEIALLRATSGYDDLAHSPPAIQESYRAILARQRGELAERDAPLVSAPHPKEQ